MDSIEIQCETAVKNERGDDGSRFVIKNCLQQILAEIRQIAQLLGLFSDSGIFFTIVFKNYKEIDPSSLKSISSIIIFIAYSIKFKKSVEIEKHLEELVQIIIQLDEKYSDNSEIMESIFFLIETIIENSGELLEIYIRPLFSILLTIQSQPNSNVPKEKAAFCIEKLAKKCNYSNVNDLHSNEMSIMLKELLEKKGFVNWTRYSPQRYKFEVIIRNACSAKILIPGCQWKAGKTHIKLRKASVINVINLIDLDIISPQELHECFKELIAVLKSCLNDEWGPDLRFASCNLIEKSLICLNSEISDDELRDLYPILLERLDDAQDFIRIEICKSFFAFFACQNLKLSSSLFEYIFKTLFVHFDDQNEEIQLKIFQVLKMAAKVNPKGVLDEANASVKKQKYPRKCQELIKICEEILLEK